MGEYEKPLGSYPYNRDESTLDYFYLTDEEIEELLLGSKVYNNKEKLDDTKMPT